MKTIIRSTQAMVFSGVCGAALFVVNFVPAQILTSIGAGAPIGAIWGGITAPFLLASSALITKRKGAIVLTYLTYSIFAIPTFVMGPPHPYKPVIAFLAGISFEIVLWLLGGPNKIGLFVGFTSFTTVSLFLYLETFKLLNLPGLQKLQSSLMAFAIVFLLLGYLGTAIAIKIHNKIKDMPAVLSIGSPDNE